MGVKIVRVPKLEVGETILPTQKPSKKPVKKRAKKTVMSLKGMEESLEKFHLSSDKELVEFIEPAGDKKDNFSHRLTPNPATASRKISTRSMFYGEAD